MPPLYRASSNRDLHYRLRSCWRWISFQHKILGGIVHAKEDKSANSYPHYSGDHSGPQSVIGSMQIYGYGHWVLSDWNEPSTDEELNKFSLEFLTDSTLDSVKLWDYDGANAHLVTLTLVFPVSYRRAEELAPILSCVPPYPWTGKNWFY